MAVHWKLFAVSLLQCLIGFNGYYHMASLNVIQPYIYDLISQSLLKHYGYAVTDADLTWVWSVVTTGYIFGYTLSSLSIETLAEKLGRRFTVGILKNVILIVASLMQYFSKTACSIELLLIGRLIAGMAGPFSDYSCVYMSECAPSTNRGLVSALPSIGYRLYIMLSIVMGLPQLLGTEELWPLVLLVPVVPAVIQILLTPLHPESPKHLFITKNQTDEAEKAVKFYHGPEADVQSTIKEYLAEQALRTNKSLGLCAVWRSPHLRWPLLVSVVASATVAVVGTDIVNQYSVEMRASNESASDSAIGTLLIVQVPSFFVTIIGMGLLLFFGRRPMFLIGLALAILGSALVAMTGFEALNTSFLSMAGMSVLLIGDCLGPTPIRLFLPGELCPQSSRSLSVSAAFFAEAALSTGITLFYPPLQHELGNFAMFLLTGASFACFVFLYFTMPETRNRTVDQVVQRWMPNNNGIEMGDANGGNDLKKKVMKMLRVGNPLIPVLCKQAVKFAKSKGDL